MLGQTEHKGIQAGISSEGIQVVRIHYSADPMKDPDTHNGKEWRHIELQGYRGVHDPRWRKEMEIDFDAHGGQLLFPYLLQYQEQLYIKPYEIKGFNVVAGLDYGTRNPSAFEVLSVDYDGKISANWEYYEPPKKRDESDEQFRARKGYKVLCAAIKKCPYFSRKMPIYADPSLWTKNQETSDPKGLRSMADLFAQEGVYLSPGHKGRDFACYEKLDSKFWKNLSSPLFTIMQTCPWLWWELQRLRFADFSEAAQINKNLQEKIVALHQRRLDMLEKGVQSPIEKYEKHLLQHVWEHDQWREGFDYDSLAPGETIGTIEDY